MDKFSGNELPEEALDQATGGRSFGSNGAASARSIYGSAATVKFRCRNDSCAWVWEAADTMLGSICPKCSTKGDKID